MKELILVKMPGCDSLNYLYNDKNLAGQLSIQVDILNQCHTRTQHSGILSVVAVVRAKLLC